MMRVITYLLLMFSTSAFSQEIMVSGTYMPNNISISTTSTILVNFINEDFVMSVIPGTLTLTIEYPNDGSVVIPTTPPYGVGADMFLWVQTSNVWTATNITLIPPFASIDIFHDLVGLNVTAPSGVATNLEVSLNPSNETNTVNNFASPLLAVKSELELTCQSLDTVYLLQNGLLDFDIDTLYTATTFPNCEPIETEFQTSLDLIDCSLDSPQVFKIYVSDQCSGLDSCVFNITIIDTFPPVLTCYNDTTLFVDDLCEVNLNLDTLIYADNCGLDTLYNDFKPTNDLSGTYTIGIFEIEFFGEDFAGNIDSCSFTIEVLDTISPTLVCTQKNIGLAFGGTNTREAKYLIDDWADNCEVVDFAVRRMESPCNPDDLVFNDDVEFCCEDVDSLVTLVLEVTDNSGNKNTCMVQVMVNDNLAPTVEPLPNITVGCDFFIDLNDLKPFGEIVKNPQDRKDIIIDGVLIGQDGLVKDNCSTDIITISDSYTDNRVNFQGDIIRYFEIDDNRNNGIIYTQQKITVIDQTILTIDDITFPRDTTIVIGLATDCLIDASAIYSGVPIIIDSDICTMPAILKEDLVFHNSGIGCAFIKRTWIVIDMAQHDPNGTSGQWTDVQYITIENHVAPILDSTLCADRTICLKSNLCEGIVDLNILASDDCTDFDQLYFRYLIDLDKNGSVDYDKESNMISEIMTEGIHLITWKVEDKCGNISKCEFNLTVKECKLPVPICYSNLTMKLNQYGEGVIWSSDLDAGSSDNCTTKDNLLFAFNENMDQTSKVFTCLDLGENKVSLHVEDESGNQSICTSLITVNEGEADCKTPLLNLVDISGSVTLLNNTSISRAKVELNDGLESIVQYSDEKGKFLFKSLEVGSTYDISSTKNDDCLNGVSTLDLVLIQRHILGIEKFDDLNKLLAADVNNSNKVNASDLVELRKMVLGISNTFSECDCWAIMDYENIINENLEYEKSSTIEIESNSSIKLKAIKIGDVNHSAISNIEQQFSNNRSPFDLKYKYENNNEENKINFSSTTAGKIFGFQMEIGLDVSPELVIGLESEFFESGSILWNVTEKGTIRVNAYAPNSINIDANETIFSFIINKEKPALEAWVNENSSMNSEIYLNNLDPHQIYLSKSSEDYRVQAFPNPFENNLMITVNSEYANKSNIKILDSTGRIIYSNEMNLTVGVNLVSLGAKEFNYGQGVYFVVIQNNNVSKKIRVIKT